MLGVGLAAAPFRHTAPLIPAAHHMSPFQGDWGLDMSSIQRAVEMARRDGICPRGLVFINPGNPTGQQLTAPQLEGLINIAHKACRCRPPPPLAVGLLPPPPPQTFSLVCVFPAAPRLRLTRALH